MKPEGECTDVAVHDFIVFCIFYDLKDFLGGARNVSACTANEYGIFGCRIASFEPKLNGKSFVLANDPVQNIFSKTCVDGKKSNSLRI